MMYPGDRVLFFAPWSSWRGMRGRVVKHGLGLWVPIDGDAHPVAVSASEVVRDEPSMVSMTGAE
jgi:hypothetical protein